MEDLKPLLLIYILPAALVFIVAFSCSKPKSKNMEICNHQYALCTDEEESGQFLVKELGLEKSPVKWCPAVSE